MEKRDIVIIEYRPPDCPAEFFINLLNELRTKVREIGNRMPNNIVTRDLNFPIIDWQMETADCGTHKNRVQTNVFNLHKNNAAIYRGAMLLMEK